MSAFSFNSVKRFIGRASLPFAAVTAVIALVAMGVLTMCSGGMAFADSADPPVTVQVSSSGEALVTLSLPAQATSGDFQLMLDGQSQRLYTVKAGHTRHLALYDLMPGTKVEFVYPYDSGTSAPAYIPEATSGVIGFIEDHVKTDKVKHVVKARNKSATPVTMNLALSVPRSPRPAPPMVFTLNPGDRFNKPLGVLPAGTIITVSVNGTYSDVCIVDKRGRC